MSATDIVERDFEWEQFVKEMEAAGPDGLGDIDSRIDYYLEKIKDGNAEIERNRVTASIRLDTISDWLAGENAKIERRNSYLVGQIGMLAPPSAEDTVAEYGKKSRTLPNGSFGFKQKPGHVEIKDMGSAVRYALEMDLPTKIVETVSKTDLKTHARATGATEGEGWEWLPGTSDFFVSPAK